MPVPTRTGCRLGRRPLWGSPSPHLGIKKARTGSQRPPASDRRVLEVPLELIGGFAGVHHSGAPGSPSTAASKKNVEVGDQRWILKSRKVMYRSGGLSSL